MLNFPPAFCVFFFYPTIVFTNPPQTLLSAGKVTVEFLFLAPGIAAG